MRVLSIETSCDETAAAVVEWSPSSSSTSESALAQGQATVLANTVSSQVALHAKWGGVVPSLASREHVRNIIPVIEETLAHSHTKPENIDLIAVTEGPGLIPALVVGVSAAKTLALVWNKPLLGIQHLEGHIYANVLRENTTLKFPLLALIVSGGHTELVLMQKHFDYAILGVTQDDAAGEAFDKAAKLLGLTYPGGPEVAKRADEYRIRTQESELKELSKKFPRPMLYSDDFNFSFSGLKTAVLYSLKKETPEKMHDEQFIASMCFAFQEAVVDVLITKTKKALKLYAPRTLVIAGGVSANQELRNRLRNLIETEFPEIQFLTPEFAYSLDNAAMIGIAAALRYERMNEKQKEDLVHTPLTLDPDANLPLQNLIS